ncbi:hypothetical protein C7H73_03375 [Pulveribacter suum]|uniref:RcnB family protein n=2 Tax=Pulveribacter suum TaxID=2116657 RepID=A0A2P1NPL3_9BURK|nr:hypothetical protein C7H73_03375 [Pulveribacter suum]
MPPQGLAYPGGDYRWERGQRYHGPRQVVHDWRHQRLRPPPAGYQWVRAESGYLLLAVPTGLILEFVAR